MAIAEKVRSSVVELKDDLRDTVAHLKDEIADLKNKLLKKERSNVPVRHESEQVAPRADRKSVV